MPPLIHFLVYTIAALVLLTAGGNLFCRVIFQFTGLTVVTPPDPIEPVRAGRVVGSLERLIMAIGLAAGSWEVLAAVIALKTVARFKELDDQKFAEYFLIGSLSSLLWASAVSGLWLAYDSMVGIKARDQIAMIMIPPEPKNESKSPAKTD